MERVVHSSTIKHAPFDPQNDGDLYIDLANLPPDTPKVTLNEAYFCDSEGTIQLPIFIVAPMMALILRCKEYRWDKRARFIDDLDFRPVCYPIPENPDCKVCRLVRRLLTHRASYEEAMLSMYLEDPIIIFEVTREIWCRFSSKVLRFSERHASYAKSISYITIPLELGYKAPMSPRLPREYKGWPACMEASLEWTNGFMFLLRNDIGERGIHSQVACFIFCNLIRILRLHVKSYVQLESREVFPQFYMLRAIRTKPVEVNRMISKLAAATAPILTEIESTCSQSTGSTNMQDRIRDYFFDSQSLILIVENILVMNMTRAFYEGVQATELYLHFSICGEKPEQCACRFARLLEVTT